MEEVIENLKNLNHRISGEDIIIGNYIYWYKEFSEYKKIYLIDYLNVQSLFKYKTDKQKRTNKNVEESSKKKLRIWYFFYLNKNFFISSLC